LEEGSYDLIIGAITITPERAKQIDFSVPYMTTTLSLVVNPELNPEIRTIANLKGRSVAVQKDTTDYTLIENLYKEKKVGEIKVYPFDQIEEMVTDVQKGTVDAMLKVSPVADWIVANNSQLKIAQRVPGFPQPLGIGINKKDVGLQKAIDHALREMGQDGSLEEIYRHWFQVGAR
jgi:ABC-type amino acid transport substrate-binding protein